ELFLERGASAEKCPPRRGNLEFVNISWLQCAEINNDQSKFATSIICKRQVSAICTGNHYVSM
ncbi:MAG TPA: hypothetical protein PKD64_17550, partial [Pirellulaceae bacterium]|nr:hypothetical protein [Pirellulaceae bacterium]